MGSTYSPTEMGKDGGHWGGRVLILNSIIFFRNFDLYQFQIPVTQFLDSQIYNPLPPPALHATFTCQAIHAFIYQLF
jgi:hypothetical protein